MGINGGKKEGDMEMQLVANQDNVHNSHSHSFEALEDLKKFKHWARTAKNMILSVLNLEQSKLDYAGLQLLSGNKAVHRKDKIYISLRRKKRFHWIKE